MRLRRRLSLLPMVLLWFLSWAEPPTSVLSPELLIRIERDYGALARTRADQLNRLLSEIQGKSDTQKLVAINDFFNQYQFASDQHTWGQSDYWATPFEFMHKGAGDCEDFTIAKYYALFLAGLEPEKLRMVYVKALHLNQAHMVLGYYAKPTAVPLILDNLVVKILPASLRTDLQPVYSFNGFGLWSAKQKGAGKNLRSGDNAVPEWQDLISRIERLEQ